MSVLVLIEVEGGSASLVSREALTFARGLGAGDLHAVVVGTPAALAFSAMFVAGSTPSTRTPCAWKHLSSDPSFDAASTTSASLPPPTSSTTVFA